MLGHPRGRISNRYGWYSSGSNTWAPWHRLNLPHDLIDSMPPKRRSLFRGIYAHDFTARMRPATTANTRRPTGRCDSVLAY